ncbi:MAG: helix-turn-helix domain-containing protein [Bacilli bacterium]|nr:helix-turn-helix domain-containing protein [Bacilli bacterium]
MNKELNNIAIYVKRTRKQYGLSQEDFALRCGVGLRFLRDLEQGKTNLNMKKVILVLDSLNADLVAVERK